MFERREEALRDCLTVLLFLAVIAALIWGPA